MTEHSALPWKLTNDGTDIRPYWTIRSSCRSQYGGDELVFSLTDGAGLGEKGQADARFVITACNCHADLLEALKKTSTIVVFGSKEQMENQITFAKSIAYKAIRKVEDQS